MKILSTLQMREADLYTIKHEPIESIDLMERAVKQLLEAILVDHPYTEHFYILCGKGNNGGDGLALARLLYQKGKQVDVFIINHTSKQSDDFGVNLEKLSSLDIQKVQINSIKELPKFDNQALIVDAILGSGLNHPIQGWLTKLIDHLNGLNNPKLAVDIPTGLFADDNADNDLNHIIQANYTYTFQLPKLSFFHRDTLTFVGEYRILNIQIHPEFVASALTKDHFFDANAAKSIFQPRKKNTYKSSYGHALLIVGSRGKIGAALLAGRACLNAGAGLLTVRVPGCGELPFQSSFPEAMVTLDSNFNQITETPENLEKYTLGIGPGLGKDIQTSRVLVEIINSVKKPMVLDADALNILAENPDVLLKLPAGSILTPHIGEFKRLLGVPDLDSDYLQHLRSFSKKYQLIVVLKDAVTAVAEPSGNVFFIDAGSPALAKAGSGDVLSGTLLALLSNGYKPIEAALLGTYIHGRAGKLAGIENSMEANLASDTIRSLGSVFKSFY